MAISYRPRSPPVQSDPDAITILSLPVELLDMIFEYLELSDIASCAQTCNKLNQVGSDPYYFHHLDLGHANMIVWRDFLNSAPPCSPPALEDNYKQHLYKRFRCLLERAQNATSMSVLHPRIDKPAGSELDDKVAFIPHSFDVSLAWFLKYVVLQEGLKYLSLACNIRIGERLVLQHPSFFLNSLHLDNSTIDFHDLAAVIRSQCESIKSLSIKNVKPFIKNPHLVFLANTSRELHSAIFQCKRLRKLSIKDSIALWYLGLTLLKGAEVGLGKQLPLEYLDVRLDLNRLCAREYGYDKVALPNPFAFESFTSRTFSRLVERTLGFLEHGSRPLTLKMPTLLRAPIPLSVFRSINAPWVPPESVKRVFPLIALQLYWPWRQGLNAPTTWEPVSAGPAELS